MEQQQGDSLRGLSDDELLRRFAAVVAQSRGNEAEVVANIAEVDARRLYLSQACASMFAYATEVLHFSEAEAFLRIAAARASREHPMLLAMLGDGRLHLTGIARLAPHLTAENRDAVLARAVHRSRRQIDELVAELAPKPDVPAVVRKLPERTRAAGLAWEPPLSDSCLAPQTQPRDGDAALANPGNPPASVGQAAGCVLLRPDGVAAASSANGAARRAHSDVVEPTAPGRYKVQFTASAELRDKLERLRALMVDAPGANDLAALIEQAVTEKLQRLEARRFGRTKRPRPAEPPCNSRRSASELPRVASRHIPAAIRRAVHRRDEGRCTFTDASGRRCQARTRLEFHHCRPWAHGGGHEIENVTLRCSSHHSLTTEADFGYCPAAHRTPGEGRLTAPRHDAHAP